jgi:AAA15 family ATPase/GTPase
MGIELAPFFQFRTVQIQARGGQNIWLDVEDGLSVIYGLNGTGKTTVIDGINQLLDSKISVGKIVGDPEYYPPRSRGYFDLSITFTSFETVYELFELFDSQSERNLNSQPLMVHLFDEGKQVIENFKLPIYASTEGKEESISEFEVWCQDFMMANDEKMAEEMRTSLKTGTFLGDSLNDEDFSKHVPFLILQKAIEKQGHAFSNPFAYHVEFLNNLRSAIGIKFTNWEFSKPNAEYANELGIKYGVKFDFDEDTFADRGFAESSGIELLNLYLYLLVEHFHNVIVSPIDDDEWFTDNDLFKDLIGQGLLVGDVIKDVARIAKVIFSAIKESLSSPLFWFESSNKIQSSLRFGLSLDLSPSKELMQLRELLEEICILFASEQSTVHSDALNFVFSQSNLLNFHTFHNFEDFDTFRSDWPCINLDFLSGIGELDDFPLGVVDLAKSINLDVVAQKTLATILRNSSAEASFSMDGYFGEGVVEIPDIGLVHALTEKISKFLQRLSIGIIRCKFEYSEDLADWVIGRSAKFVFETVSTKVGNSEYGIPFSRLSSAQRYWVQAAFWLLSVESDDGAFVVIADEPESGLHERAIIQVFNELSKTNLTCVVTSHSSRALRLPHARLLHLERAKSGELVLGRPWLGEDVSAAAERLGTTTFDLFALKRALVIVEGSHDVEVISGLASLHIDGVLLDQLLIVPARGVRNVATVADSVVITEFTSLHILAITDNGRAEVLKEIISKASEALSAGATTAQAIFASGIKDVDKAATFEERVMHDLIERAIHRGLLHRLHIYALPVEDIVDLLPEKAFGLEKTWKALRDEHRSFPLRMSFKDWLRQEKGVSVSARSVKRAFDSIDSLNEPLRRILHELEIVSALSPLEGTF